MRDLKQLIRWILLGCSAAIFFGLLLLLIEDTPK